MFDSLADRIKQDERQGVSNAQRVMIWASIVVVSIALFGGLYLVVRLVE
jgi:hypothetical protein